MTKKELDEIEALSEEVESDTDEEKDTNEEPEKTTDEEPEKETEETKKKRAYEAYKKWIQSNPEKRNEYREKYRGMYSATVKECKKKHCEVCNRDCSDIYRHRKSHIHIKNMETKKPENIK